MTETNFTELLQGNVDDAEPPIPKPEGAYLFQVTGLTEGKSKDLKTPFVEIGMLFLEAAQNVDQAALEEALQGESLTAEKMSTQFYITKKSMFRLRAFMEACGLQTEGRAFKDCLGELKGQQVWGDLTHTPGKNDNIYSNVNKFYSEAPIAE